MSWNGHPVIDLDSHIVERADRFYGDYMDPAYRDAALPAWLLQQRRARTAPQEVSQ